jgi:D-alanyl-D-alanine carboxypeptidase
MTCSSISTFGHYWLCFQQDLGGGILVAVRPAWPPTAVLLIAVLATLVAPAATATAASDVRLQRQLDALVKAKGGPPGVIVTLRRGARARVLTAGVADVKSRRAPRARDHMRIASVAKAFSGAVALRLVADGKLELDDTIGGVLQGLPGAWSAVTVRQMLGHTSGLPDYTKSAGFGKQFQDDPGGYVSPDKVIGWVRGDPLVFTPGTRYEYSNTDNIVVGLIAEKVSGMSYPRLLRKFVFQPLRLTQTSFPISPPLPRPFIHGYVVEGAGPPDDVSTLLSPSGAWASGAIVSTPRDLNKFIGGYLAGRLFPASLQRDQLRFVRGGRSSPPGPGRNSAGLAVFRYQTKCGTVYGHTGNFPGYVQFAAATRHGGRAVTTSLNIPAPKGKLLARLRAVQQTAVCALLR